MHFSLTPDTVAPLGVQVGCVDAHRGGSRRSKGRAAVRGAIWQAASTSCPPDLLLRAGNITCQPDPPPANPHPHCGFLDSRYPLPLAPPSAMQPPLQHLEIVCRRPSYGRS